MGYYQVHRVKVINGEANETKLLLFTDGGSGSAEDVAVVIYDEGGIQKWILMVNLTLTNVLNLWTYQI